MPDADRLPGADRLERLLAANRAYAAALDPVSGARPGLGVALLTCMDTRIDALAVAGLRPGAAHVLRNAGGRVTADVLRSLAVSVHLLGVDTLVVMQHTRCGMAGVGDRELRERTGADVDFLPIDDHTSALRADVATVAGTPYLAPLEVVAGWLYDVQTGEIAELVRWRRPD